MHESIVTCCDRVLSSLASPPPESGYRPARNGAVMASVTTNRSWLVPVFALALATFAVCTAELMIAGLLPAVAHALDADIPTAGLLITGYALGVAIAGPILALLTTGVSRRFLLIAVMAVFVAGNILCALSGTYWMLL